HLAREQRGVFGRVLRVQHLRLPLGSTVDSILQRAFACAQLVADAAPDSPTRFAEPFEQTSGARALRYLQRLGGEAPARTLAVERHQRADGELVHVERRGEV